MGVTGLTSILIEDGFMPPKNGCHQSLWYEGSLNEQQFQDQQPYRITIPSGSSLHLDGNGFAYWINGVAYSRWYDDVLYGQSSQRPQQRGQQQQPTSTTADCTCPHARMKQLTSTQVTQLLPQFLPPIYLERALQEFFQELLHIHRNYHVTIYWDGPGRRCKGKTTQRRYDTRTVEWNTLQQYCDYGGILPFKTCCQTNFIKYFPKPRLLLLQQVQTTIRSIASKYHETMTIIQCMEEADSEVAKGAVQSDGYVIGLDSDYCLFRNVKYLPLTSLSLGVDDISGGLLSAHCITRQDLANEMDLGSNDELLIELAILNGNDFLEANGQAELDFYPLDKFQPSIPQIVEYLKEQSSSTYRATSTSSDEQVHVAMRFCRALYNLESLEEFPLDNENIKTVDDSMMMVMNETTIITEDDEYNIDTNSVQQQQQQQISADRPMIPKEMNLDLAIPEPLDHTFMNVVIRPLQDYIQNTTTTTTAKKSTTIQLHHLHAYQEMTTTLAMMNLDNHHYGSSSSSSTPSSSLLPTTTTTTLFQRPTWENVVAAYIIERVILTILNNSPDAPIVRYQTPYKIWNPYLFHSILYKQQQQQKKEQEETTQVNDNNHANDNMEPPQQQQQQQEPIQEKVILPIDEYEDEIIKAVHTQRITIIHGETGCGKSSRVPIMLLHAGLPPNSSSQEVKLFVSQPRRIAAKSLVDRIRSTESESSDLRNAIALRMGHGVREFESRQTRAWFVTTGYLVRLLANHPETFDSITYLIIDEVHERSVDTDILCLLCRRLLAERNPNIRLILMSATLAADMYASYFGVPTDQYPLIHVGSRRFPIHEYFVEDLVHNFRLPNADQDRVKEIAKYCEKTKCRNAPSALHCEKLFKLAVRIVTVIVGSSRNDNNHGSGGIAILIFVPGMSDIINIIDLMEKQHSPGIVYTTTPIHSDIPFEEQMTAFDPPATNEVKVIVATNAAESSVTLPSVDHVICTGLCKQVIYNPTSHRQMLSSAWISKASATQRAGRTGRVRPGNVYRLYTKHAYMDYMDKFERGEMLRIPLDSVILLVKEILHEEGTVPVLQQTLEPPSLDTIERSFQSLHRNFFLDQPNDEGNITILGSFVQSIGVDLALGSFIGLAIQFGVGPEAIEMAAVMSFPKTVWTISSAIFHEPKEFNEMTSRIFQSKCHFDAKLYSDPLATMNLMYEYTNRRRNVTGGWFCKQYAIHQSRLKRLLHTRDNLRKRVADFCGMKGSDHWIKPKKPPSQMDSAKLTILRCLQVWVFSDSVVEAMHVCNPIDDSYIPITFRGKPIQEWHLEQILNKERHSFELVTNQEMEQVGKFFPVLMSDENDDDDDNNNSAGDQVDSSCSISFDISTFLEPFTERLVSYAVEKNYDLVYYTYEGGRMAMMVLYDLVSTPAFTQFKMDKLAGCVEGFITAYKRQDGSQRGRGERACGQWQIRDGLGGGDGNEDEEDDDEFTISFQIFCSPNSNASKGMSKYLRQKGMQIDGVRAIFGCNLHRYTKPNDVKSPSFSITLIGDVEEVTMVDLRDLFATPNLTNRTTTKAKGTQQVRFSIDENSNGYEGHHHRSRTNKNSKNKKSGRKSTAFLPRGNEMIGSSWGQPLVNDIPEGARILSVLASSSRKHSITFQDGKNEDTGEENAPLDITLSRTETRIGERWKRLDSTFSVYVQENSVPGAVVCTDGAMEVFACCANAMEIKGGGIRVDTLTLLPPGRAFILLAYLTFGITPFTFFGEEDDVDELVDQSLGWLQSWTVIAETLGVPSSVGEDDSIDFEDMRDRIESAHAFHRSSWYMGEELVCQPDRVRALLNIFAGVDPYLLPNNEWEGLASDPFIPKEERDTEYRYDTPANGTDEQQDTSTSDEHKKFRSRKSYSRRSSDNSMRRNSGSADKNNDVTNGYSGRRSSEASIRKQDSSDSGRRARRKRQPKKKGNNNSYYYNKKVVDVAVATVVTVGADQAVKLKCLFLEGLEEGKVLTSSDLPSTNILSLVVKTFCQLVIDRNLMPEDRTFMEQASKEGFNVVDWEIFTIEAFGESGPEVWYFADYVASVIPYLPVKGRSSAKGARLDTWIFKGLSRPWTSKQALACVPTDFAAVVDWKAFQVTFPGGQKPEQIVAFNSVETAVRMGAAYWLERQFTDGSNHWYQVTLQQMTDKLTQSMGLT